MKILTNTTCVPNQTLESTVTKSIKVYFCTCCGLAYMMYIIDNEPYYNLDGLFLETYTGMCFEFGNGDDLTKIYRYADDVNTIVVEDHYLKRICLVSSIGLTNVLLYVGLNTYYDDIIDNYNDFVIGRYKPYLLYEGEAKVTYHVVNTGSTLSDEDKDFIEFFISEPADKLTSANMFDNVCIRVYDLLNLVGYNGEISDDVMQRGFFRMIKDTKNKKMELVISLNNVSSLCDCLGISIDSWMPIWKRIVNCYKIKEKNYGE